MIVVVVDPGRLRGIAGLVDDVVHVVRRHELRLLDVHRLAAGRDRMDEIGLAGEEGGRLQHVDDLGDRPDLRDVVDVGQHRHADLVAHLGEDLQALVHARPAEARARRAIGLVEARLEDERHPDGRGQLLQSSGGLDREFTRFDRTGSGDQEQRPIEPDLVPG